jgi:hypothetical protein
VFARALGLAGDAASALGSLKEAREYWESALEVFNAIGSPEADVVRGQLAVTT